MTARIRVTMMGTPGKPKLLVVEDDEDVQRAVKRVAEAAGYEVLQEFDGVHVPSVVRNEAPDVVLLDLDMPNSDGHDVLKRLKDDPRTAGVPIVICSSHEKDDPRAEARFGADDYLEKPCEPGLLLTSIARVRGC